jgi:chemotaxis protein MotB
MANAAEETPIRIVKKKAGHGGHHGGAWKVAYADFVTAMMALFIVLWIVGQSKQVKESVASYFKDPGAFEFSKGGAGAMNGGPSAVEGSSVNALEAQRQALEKLGSQIMQEIASNPELKAIASQVKFEIVNEGMRIELLEKSESFFFDVGTSELKPEAAKIIAIIAAEVGKLPNKLVIEGHTDARQYSRSDGYSNFELSAERANSARRIMARNGVKLSQVDQVRGYADTRLRDTENPNDIINRRISVLVKFK